MTLLYWDLMVFLINFQMKIAANVFGCPVTPPRPNYSQVKK